MTFDTQERWILDNIALSLSRIAEALEAIAGEVDIRPEPETPQDRYRREVWEREACRKEWLKLPVPLPTRFVNAMTWNRVYPAEAAKLSDGQLATYRNVGTKMIAEARQAFAQMNLQ